MFLIILIIIIMGLLLFISLLIIYALIKNDFDFTVDKESIINCKSLIVNYECLNNFEQIVDFSLYEEYGIVGMTIRYPYKEEFQKELVAVTPIILPNQKIGKVKGTDIWTLVD